MYRCVTRHSHRVFSICYSAFLRRIGIAFHRKHISRAKKRHDLTHGITCHLTQVNALCLNSSRQSSTRFAYPRGMKSWVDRCVGYVIPKWSTCLQTSTSHLIPGFKPMTSRSHVQRPTIALPSHHHSVDLGLTLTVRHWSPPSWRHCPQTLPWIFHGIHLTVTEQPLKYSVCIDERESRLLHEKPGLYFLCSNWFWIASTLVP